VLDAEPAPVLRLDAVDLDEALHAVADFADMKSRWFLGRSAGVSALVNRAAAALGASDEQRRALRRAALVHDIGRVGAPSGIWDHPGPLTGEQWERVRLHPYLSERVLRPAGRLWPQRQPPSGAGRWIRLPPRPDQRRAR
jgi:HD-GYP domain-containing protein (c-di-GMP phosphodiesterase class II)